VAAFETVVQSVLLYDGESWVLHDKESNKFSPIIARYVTGQHIRPS
jgi:hypothetical protein